jgi:hypothetical protein
MTAAWCPDDDGSLWGVGLKKWSREFHRTLCLLGRADHGAPEVRLVDLVPPHARGWRRSEGRHRDEVPGVGGLEEPRRRLEHRR